MANALSCDPFSCSEKAKQRNKGMTNGAQNKASLIMNVRGRLGIAEEAERPTAGFLTPLVLNLLPADGPLPIPNPIG